MSNLAYIDELGVGTPEVDDTEVETNEPEEQSEVETDLSLEQEDTPATEEAERNTEPNSELLKSLQKQIEGMEKRIADKDAYINELREASKQKEAEKEQRVDTKEDDDDFWDNPEEKFKSLKEQLKIQQLQIQETVYANTVENYWKTVNPDALKEAVATDADFAKEFNASSEPYKTAYEYLTEKAKSKETEKLSLREQIKKELLEEMGLNKSKKEAPPSINNGGKSSSTKPNVSDDGFASVYGSEY